MDRHSVAMNLICSLGHCECDGHTAHKLSQRRLTADWLAPWESDCSRMHSKVSSDWLHKLHQSHATGSRDIQNGWILPGQTSYSDLFLPTHYRRRRLLLHPITLNDTYTFGRNLLDEGSDRRRDLYLTTHNTHNRQTSMLPAGFEPTVLFNQRLQIHD